MIIYLDSLDITLVKGEDFGLIVKTGNSYTWCPCCGKCYILSEEEVVNAIDNDLSVYAECSCGNSFYIETEDEQDNYSEW